jgi:adenylylsulfate kinase-like enzyme
MGDRGMTLWFTGLPSAGKSTIAECVMRRLHAHGVRSETVDGDDLRRNLTRASKACTPNSATVISRV